MITMTSPIVLGNGSIACTLLKHCWVACNVHCLHSCHYVPQEALHLGSTVVGRLQCPVGLVMGTTSGYRPMSIACTLLGSLAMSMFYLYDNTLMYVHYLWHPRDIFTWLTY